MPDARETVVLGPGEGRLVDGPVGGPLTFKLRGEQSGGNLTAVENVIPPGGGPPAHVHAGEDESWYVLEGTLRFRVGEETSEAPVGSFVFVPRGVVHCFRNYGEQPARILVLFTPSGMERFFDRIAAMDRGDVRPETFGEIGAEVGMEVVGPPMGAE